MKSKKIYLPLLFILSISLIGYFVFIRPHRTRVVETFLKSFPKQEFLSKLKQNHPRWMNEQINLDLKDFSPHSIKSDAIDKTYNQIVTSIPSQKNSFIRYRIINNKVYRYYPKDVEITKREPSFEKAIKTLTKLVKLDDSDFIYSDMDGTPEFYTPNDFYFVEDGKNQAPLFSRAKNLDAPFVVLIPDYYSVSTSWENDCISMLREMKNYPWENKSAQAFWRGGSHDKGYDAKSFKKRPRIAISLLSKKYPNLIEAGINKTEHMQFLEVIEKEGLIKPFATVTNHLKYKYLPVLDGYMCTYPGYQWRLLSNSVCFKQKSKEVQWFYSALQPYEHYIPVENDMSDLVEKLNWAKSSDEICKQISKNATDFVLKNLMLEDVYLYLNKALLSYSECLDIDKEELLKNTQNDPNWVCIQSRTIANKKLLKMKEMNEK